jgi:hypothetical protein
MAVQGELLLLLHGAAAAVLVVGSGIEEGLV